MIETATHDSLRDTLLIAMPQMDDPNFAESVVYLCDHNSEGAMGLVINRPLNVCVGDLFKQIGLNFPDEAPHYQDHVFLGGPVDMEHGFVLHTHKEDSPTANALHITPDLSLTSSQAIFDSIAAGEGPNNTLVALGYAGWGPGQLENELAQNIWLNSPADRSILFSTPIEHRLTRAAARIGVDLTLLSHEAGHA
ncbi:YqgE/AlgH family protein [Sansalvadorimonas sp. 2012CJ34-2]|uniref:UPF0301 protein M3P05_00620 n=1 Tax=Parendozoicomonas callyspongiae TaxID=2942213 RepID=A0ABT0PD35_9GAMM|nr:YqgE/AlgH family protein [Sansalvadorimonas sp. 2012CJ34-2]MCL6268453.1 YqgE/AlgH family protein [Sansalvadorimonas sp. 2012CJ34-2]